MPVNLLPQRIPGNIADPVGRAVARLGVTPNMVSLTGFCGNLLCAWLIAAGHLLPAGLVYLFFSALDLVDGAVARATGQATAYGAVLDAVLDRASEVIVLAGCAWYFAGRDEWWQVGFVDVAIVASVAVSFVRAVAEAAGLEMREGMFRRQERVVLLGAGMLFGLLTVAVVILALLSALTAFQRSAVAFRSFAADR